MNMSFINGVGLTYGLTLVKCHEINNLSVHWSPYKNIRMTFKQCRPNVGPTLYKMFFLHWAAPACKGGGPDALDE